MFGGWKETAWIEQRDRLGYSIVVALFVFVLLTGAILFAGSALADSDSGACDVVVESDESIQDAIDDASYGDVICVESGTYDQRVWIDRTNVSFVDDDDPAANLTVRAADPTDPPVLDGTDLEAGIQIDHVDDVVIDGFELGQYDAHGIAADSVNGLEIRNVTVTENNDTGVSIVDGSDVTVRDSEFEWNGEHGLEIESESDPLLDGLTIEENYFVGHGAEAFDFHNAISISGADSPTIADNEFENNARAVYIEGTDAPELVNNDIVDHSRGILVDGSASTDFDSPYIVDNTIENYTVKGIKVDEMNDITVRDNVLFDTPGRNNRPYSTGIYLRDDRELSNPESVSRFSGAVVENNTIANEGPRASSDRVRYGIRIEGNFEGPTVSDNELHPYSGSLMVSGLDVDGEPVDPVVKNNVVRDGDNRGIEIYADGPHVFDNEVHNNTGTGIFNGETRSDGLFENNTVTNNSRGLYGFGNRTIARNNELDGNSQGILLEKAVVEDQPAAEWTVRNNTVTNTSEYAVRFRGAYNESELSDFRLLNNTIRDGTGDGIYVDESNSITIQDNEITNFTGDGIATEDSSTLYNRTPSLSAVSNEITDTRRGVNLLDADGITLSNNEITNSTEEGVKVFQDADDVTIEESRIADGGDHGITAQTFSVDAPEDLVIDGNEIVDNDGDGIFMRTLDSASVSEPVVTSNTIAGNAVDLRLAAATNATIHDNIFGTGLKIDPDELDGDELDGYVHDVENNVFEDGRPLFYALDEDVVAVPDDAGQVFVVNSSDVEVTDGHHGVSGAKVGVVLAYSDGATISNVTVTDVDGAFDHADGEAIHVRSSDSVVIDGATIQDNDRVIETDRTADLELRHSTIESNAEGIEFDAVDGLSVLENDVSDNVRWGINVGSSTNVTIRDNDVTGSDDSNGPGLGIRSQADSENVTIRDNAVTDNDGNGIEVSVTADASVRDNVVTANDGRGLHLSGSVDAIRAETNTIENNAEAGIYVTSVDDAEIIDNALSANTGEGIVVVDGSNATLADNELTHNDDVGILLDETDTPTVRDNTILDNEKAGVRDDGSHDPAIVENTIRAADTDDQADGIQLEYAVTADEVTVERNLIEETNVGISVSNPSTEPDGDVSIAGNTIRSNEYGVDVENERSEGLAIHRNLIEDNDAAGLNYRAWDEPADLNATDNWWGDETGPSGGVVDPQSDEDATGDGDRIDTTGDATDRVLFDPWIDTPGTLSVAVRDENDDPIDGATVTLEGTDGDVVGSWSTTADGTAAITAPEDEYDVIVDHDYYDEVVESAVDTESTDSITVELPFSATISGTVTDSETNDPIDGATVEIRDSDSDDPITIDTVQTDPDGDYGAGAIDGQENVVDISADGYERHTESLVVDDTETLSPALDPATIVTADLSVSETDVYLGSYVTVSATVENVDDSAATYTVPLVVDGETADHADGSLAGESSERVTFPLYLDESGTFEVGIDDLDPVSVSVTAAWSQYGLGNGNIGFAEDLDGPTDAVDAAWTFAIDSEMYSSPAIVDDVVYVGANDDRLYAVDADAGVEDWNVTTDDEAWSSPAVDDGIVYVGSTSGTLYALDAADGTEAWNRSVGDDVRGPVTVVGDTVYVGLSDEDDSALYALDVADGSERWSFDVDGSIQVAPAVVEDIVYIASMDDDGTVYALNASDEPMPADERERWSFETSDSVRSSPTIADGTVYFGSGFGVGSGAVYALDASDGSERWNHTTTGTVEGSPAVADETVFVGEDGGSVFALDGEDGSVEWEFETGADGIGSSPAVADETVYVGVLDTSDPRVYGIDAETGDEQWHHEVDGTVLSGPAVYNDSVYVGSHYQGLLALEEPDDGAVLDVSDVSVNETTIEEDDPLLVSATVSNVGGESGAFTVTLQDQYEDNAPTDRDELTVELDPDESEDIAFVHSLSTPGEWEIFVEGVSAGTVDVDDAPDDIDETPGAVDAHLDVDTPDGTIVGLVIHSDDELDSLTVEIENVSTGQVTDELDLDDFAEESVDDSLFYEANVDVAAEGLYNVTLSEVNDEPIDEQAYVAVNESINVTAFRASPTEGTNASIELQSSEPLDAASIQVSNDTGDQVATLDIDDFVHDASEEADIDEHYTAEIDLGEAGTYDINLTSVGDESFLWPSIVTVGEPVDDEPDDEPIDDEPDDENGVEDIVDTNLSVDDDAVDLDHITLDAFYAGGLLQIQLTNDTAEADDLTNRTELAGLGATGDTVFDVEVEVDADDREPPRVLVGSGNVNEWSVAEDEANDTFAVSFSVRPIGVETLIDCDIWGDVGCVPPTEQPGDWSSVLDDAEVDDRATDSKQAAVEMAADPMSDLPGETEADLFDGMIIATNAQEFGFPQYDPGTDDEPPSISQYVAAPSETKAGEANDGFFEAVLPNNLLDEWGVESPDALGAHYEQVSETAELPVTPQLPDGSPSGDEIGDEDILLEIDVHYSDGEVTITTADSANEIEDWHDLDDVRDDLDDDYVLVNDLTESTDGYEEVAGPDANEGLGFEPIGDFDNRFSGTLDGDGHEIQGLTIDRVDTEDEFDAYEIGLIGFLEDGTVEDIHLNNVNITGNENVAAIAGQNEGGVVEDSSVQGNITGSTNVGGVIGQQNDGEVHRTDVDGSIEGDSFATGGIIGDNAGQIIETSVRGTVTGNSAVGGIAGWHATGTIERSYSLATVAGDDSVAGIVGDNSADINRTYAAGGVSGNSDVGGLIGEHGGGILEDSYWDTEETEHNEAVGEGDGDIEGDVTGLSTAEMTGDAAEGNMTAFDFETNWVTTDSYPVLFAEKPQVSAIETFVGETLVSSDDEPVEEQYTLTLDEEVEGVTVSFQTAGFDADSIAEVSEGEVSELFDEDEAIEITTDEQGQATLNVTWSGDVRDAGALEASISETDERVSADDIEDLRIGVDTRLLAAETVDIFGDATVTSDDESATGEYLISLDEAVSAPVTLTLDGVDAEDVESTSADKEELLGDGVEVDTDALGEVSFDVEFAAQFEGTGTFVAEIDEDDDDRIADSDTATFEVAVDTMPLRADEIETINGEAIRLARHVVATDNETAERDYVVQLNEPVEGAPVAFDASDFDADAVDDVDGDDIDALNGNEDLVDDLVADDETVEVATNASGVAVLTITWAADVDQSGDLDALINEEDSVLLAADDVQRLPTDVQTELKVVDTVSIYGAQEVLRDDAPSTASYTIALDRSVEVPVTVSLDGFDADQIVEEDTDVDASDLVGDGAEITTDSRDGEATFEVTFAAGIEETPGTFVAEIDTDDHERIVGDDTDSLDVTVETVALEADAIEEFRAFGDDRIRTDNASETGSYTATLNEPAEGVPVEFDASNFDADAIDDVDGDDIEAVNGNEDLVDALVSDGERVSVLTDERGAARLEITWASDTEMIGDVEASIDADADEQLTANDAETISVDVDTRVTQATDVRLHGDDTVEAVDGPAERTYTASIVDAGGALERQVTFELDEDAFVEGHIEAVSDGSVDELLTGGGVTVGTDDSGEATLNITFAAGAEVMNGTLNASIDEADEGIGESDTAPVNISVYPDWLDIDTVELDGAETITRSAGLATSRTYTAELPENVEREVTFSLTDDELGVEEIESVEVTHGAIVSGDAADLVGDTGVVTRTDVVTGTVELEIVFAGGVRADDELTASIDAEDDGVVTDADDSLTLQVFTEAIDDARYLLSDPIAPDTVDPGEEFTANVTVENVGGNRTQDVVFLLAEGGADGDYTPDPRVAFEVVDGDAMPASGERANVSISIDAPQAEDEYGYVFISGETLGTTRIFHRFDESREGVITVGDPDPDDEEEAALSAAFDVEPAEPLTGEEVTLNASESTEAVEYQWNSTDDPSINVTTTDDVLTHSFEAAGEYEVVLTVTAEDGTTDTTTETIDVRASECFIATASFGTERAEEIDTLRDFRDEVLLQHPAGELMVELYYDTSPPIADWIAQTEERRWIVRELFVKPLVEIVSTGYDILDRAGAILS